MNLKYTLTSLSLVALSSFAVAGEKCSASCDKDAAVTVATEECTTGHCDKDTATTIATKECAVGHCDKDATTTVATKECAAGHCDKDAATTVAAKECTEGSCDSHVASSATYVVSGMTCVSCADKVKTSLVSVDGVQVNKVCHKSGHVAVSFDEKKTDKAAVLTALKSTGFEVAGEQISIPVSGMNCGKCSTKLTAALNAVDGCTVGTVCHKSGHATVTIDPAKTSEAKIIETITSKGYKAGETAEVKTATIKAPAKS